MTRAVSTLALSLALAACAGRDPDAPVASAEGATSPASPSTSAPSAVDAAPAPGTPAPVAPAAPTSVPVEARLAQGAALLQQGDVAKARSLLASVVVEQPRNALAQYNLGYAALALGDAEGARVAFEAATSADPALGAAWAGLVQLELAAGRPQRAWDLVQQGKRMAPASSELRVAEVAVLRRLGKGADALRVAREAIAVDAYDLELYSQLGLVYLDLGRHDLARFILEKAQRELEGGNGHPVIQASLGRAYAQQGERVRAEECFERALELDPNMLEAQRYLAAQLLENRAWPSAAALLERSKTLAPADPGIRLDLGVAYRGMGRYDDARREYEEALRLAPNDASPLLNIGILLGDYKKDYDGALVAYQSYLDRQGPQAELAESYIASTQREQERVARAERARKQREDRRKQKEQDEAVLKEPQGEGTPAPEGGGE